MSPGGSPLMCSALEAFHRLAPPIPSFVPPVMEPGEEGGDNTAAGKSAVMTKPLRSKRVRDTLRGHIFKMIKQDREVRDLPQSGEALRQLIREVVDEMDQELESELSSSSAP